VQEIIFLFVLSFIKSSKQGKRRGKKQQEAIIASFMRDGSQGIRLSPIDKVKKKTKGVEAIIGSIRRDDDQEVRISSRGKEKIGEVEARKSSIMRDGDQRARKSPTNKVKNTRGPTKMLVIAKRQGERKTIQFNERDQPVGEESVKFSSFLGVLAREIVPITHDSWVLMDDKSKERLWVLVKV
jgi:hypothetical protein